MGVFIGTTLARIGFHIEARFTLRALGLTVAFQTVSVIGTAVASVTACQLIVAFASLTF